MTLYLSVCPSVSPPVSQTLYLSVHPSVCLSICLSFDRPLHETFSITSSILRWVVLSFPSGHYICRSVFLSVCSSVFLSVRLSIRLSVRPSINLSAVWPPTASNFFNHVFYCLFSSSVIFLITYLSVHPSFCLSGFICSITNSECKELTAQPTVENRNRKVIFTLIVHVISFTMLFQTDRIPFCRQYISKHKVTSWIQVRGLKHPSTASDAIFNCWLHAQSNPVHPGWLEYPAFSRLYRQKFPPPCRDPG